MNASLNSRRHTEAADPPGPAGEALTGPETLDLGAVFRDSHVGDVLDELDRELVGLVPVKSRIRDIAALLIVDRAVNTDQNRKYVFVVGEGNKIEYRRIELGRVTQGLRVVRKGLKAGETIVVDGAERVHPGIAVQPQTVAMTATDISADSAAVH